MKKILFVLIALITLCFTSCQSSVKKDIKNFENTDYASVYKTKVNKIHLENHFYEFQEDYVKAFDELYWKEHDLEMCNVTITLGKSENLEHLVSKSEIEYSLENKPKLEKSIDSLNRVIDSIKAECISGDLYVAKMVFKDRFGGIKDDYVFKVYYYDKDKNLKVYDGEEKYRIKNASFSYHDEYYSSFFFVFEDW